MGGRVWATLATLPPQSRNVKTLDPYATARHNQRIMRHCARFSFVLPALLALAIGCSNPPPSSSATGVGPSVPGGQVAIGQLPDIDMSAVLTHTKKLSSDEFEGRLPGTKGSS